MKAAALCLCLVSTICAAPMTSFYEYLPQAGGPRQPIQNPQQRNNPFVPQAQPPQQPAINAPLSIEMVMLPKYGNNGAPTGGWQGAETLRSQAFLKYKMPKSPGMKSVEIFYPIDYAQQQQLFAGYGYMPPTLPQQNQNPFPSFTVPQAGAHTGPQEPPQPLPPAQGVQSVPKVTPNEPKISGVTKGLK